MKKITNQGIWSWSISFPRARVYGRKGLWVNLVPARVYGSETSGNEIRSREMYQLLSINYKSGGKIKLLIFLKNSILFLIIIFTTLTLPLPTSPHCNSCPRGPQGLPQGSPREKQEWSAVSFAARVATNKMAFEEGARHKSGPLKQQNKTHKHGRHRSKSEIDKTNKGKAAALSVEFRVSRLQVLLALQTCESSRIAGNKAVIY